jgi:hypothetical protein
MMAASVNPVATATAGVDEKQGARRWLGGVFTRGRETAKRKLRVAVGII